MKLFYSPKKWLLCLSTLLVGGTAAQAQILEQWSFATDSFATTVATGVVGTAPTLSHLYTSRYAIGNADTPNAYSTYYGQALGANDGASGGFAGDGLWSHTSGDGPGSKLYLAQQGSYFEQFVLTADASHSLTLDSVSFNNGFLNSSSNTSLWMEYSQSGFVSDSGTLCSYTSVADSIVLGAVSGDVSAPNSPAHFSLAPCSPIAVPAGHSLTWRLFWGCGSSSPDRFSLLQNFTFVGTVGTEGVATIQPRAEVSIYPNPATDEINVNGTLQSDVISITNVLGKEVARYNCNGGTESLSVSSLSPALYIVRVLSANGEQISVQKLTKN